MEKFLPKILSVDITNKCNSCCIYCRDIHNNKKRELTEGEMLKAIKKVVSEIKSLEWLKISGGEPLLFKRIEELVSFCKNRKINTILQTNGKLLTKETARKLKEAGLTKVQLSIDGSKEIQDKLRGEGLFEAVAQAVKTCNDTRLIFQLKCTISNINKDEIEGLFLLARKWRPEKLNFRFLLPIGKAKISNFFKDEIKKEEKKQIIKKVYNLSIKYGIEVITGDPCSYLFFSSLKNVKIKDYEGACTIGTNSIHVSSDGYYNPCSMLDVNLGDILKENFWNVWHNNDFLQKNRERNFLKCRYCVNKKVCGGCRVIAYANSGDYFGEDVSCYII